MTARLIGPPVPAPSEDEPAQRTSGPDPDAKVVLVTGATDGIGRETALLLARHGAHVIVHGRSRERVELAIEYIRKKEPAAALDGVVADLSSLSAVRALADGLRERRLDVLINNAGVYMRERQLSPDGFEMTFAVNYLAPFLLTHLLLPALAHKGGRVVNVTSIAHLRCRLDWDNLQGERNFDDYQVYASAKLGLVLFSAELARRLGAGPPTTNSVHPGVVSTKLLRDGFGVEGTDRIEHAAALLGYLALADALADTTAKYFAEGRPARAHALAGDPRTAGRFYDMTCALVGIEGLPRRRTTQG